MREITNIWREYKLTLFWFTVLEMTFQSWAYTVVFVFGPYKNREWTEEKNSGVMSQEVKSKKENGKGRSHGTKVPF